MKFLKRIRLMPIVVSVLVVIVISFAVSLTVMDESKKESDNQSKTAENDVEENLEVHVEEQSELISSETAKVLIQKSETASGEIDAEETIVCGQYSFFSGQYVEDGRDELVENVAAILVTNTSDQFLELCTLQYDIDGTEAIFVVTGLPAGRSAWVMEKHRLTIGKNASFTYQGCATAYKENVAASTDKISLFADGNMMKAKNNTDKTLDGVYVYYKTLHSDGNYFGGITYLVDFGSIEPGESVEKLAGHYVEGSTEIVRIGWKDS